MYRYVHGIAYQFDKTMSNNLIAEYLCNTWRNTVLVTLHHTQITRTQSLSPTPLHLSSPLTFYVSIDSLFIVIPVLLFIGIIRQQLHHPASP